MSFLSVISLPLAVFSQSSDAVVINEIELNPPGSDSGGAKEFVELYNLSDSDVDVSGWVLSPSKFSYKNLVLPENSIIPKNGFLVLTHVGFWLSDHGDSLTLKNSSDIVIDSSPILQDMGDDMLTWQRITDGFDSNLKSDWIMKLSTPNSSNGKISELQEEAPISVSLILEKESFYFDELMIISGSVSDEVFIERPSFYQEPISIIVSGPNDYVSNFNIYPDRNLQYSTSLKIQQTLGFEEGQYKINVEYAGASSSSQFNVTYPTQSIIEPEKLQLIFDPNKESYLLGETVVFSGKINSIQNLSRLYIEIFDPNGDLFNSGNVFPNSTGEFTFEVFLPNVNTNFGKYHVDISYIESDQYGYLSVKQSINTSFLVIEDIRADELISLSTNKPVYSLGETISIVGRSNSYWVPSLNLQVIQSGTQAFHGDQSDDVGSEDPFNFNDVVRLNGDNTFAYDLKIPSIPERLGDYTITIYQDFGTTSLNFVISDDPENYLIEQLPFTLKIDNTSYMPNETIKISGKIADLQKRFGVLSSVKISFFDSHGIPVTINACLGDNNDECNSLIPIELSSIPDLSGNYNNEATLFLNAFSPGIYTIKATFEEFTALQTFEIKSNETDFQDTDSLTPITLSLDKTIFNVGETINVSGFVTPADINPDSDDVQTKSVHTNFRLAQHNIINVLIPYPLYLTTVPDASVTTSTDEEYVGGGVRGTDSGKGSYDGKITFHKSVLLLNGFESNILPNSDGTFSTSFNLRPGVFFDGEYIVRATYHGESTEIPIRIIDSTLTGGQSPALTINTDKTHYFPGDTVNITGLIENVFYFDSVELVVKNEAQTKFDCLKMNCGLGNNVKRIRINESTGTFSSNYEIPDGVQSLGKYQIIAKTHFDTVVHEFEVVESLDVKTYSEVPSLTKIIEKVGRIPESSIDILLDDKTIEQTTLSPRVLQGSVFTPIRGAELDVNLTLTTDSGVCVIGQDTSCLISDSTRAPGEIFEIIQLEGKSYKIRYSGPDAKLEKFSILPEDDSEIFPKSSWNVEISKDGQPSRFYYKISYLKTE